MYDKVSRDVTCCFRLDRRLWTFVGLVSVFQPETYRGASEMWLEWIVDPVDDGVDVLIHPIDQNR